MLTVSVCLATEGEDGRQHILTLVYRKVTAFEWNTGLKQSVRKSTSFHLTRFETSWHTMVVKLVWLKRWFSDDRLIHTPRKTQKNLRISCEYTGDKNGTLSHERAARLKGTSSSKMFLGHSYASDTDITHKTEMGVWDMLHKFLQNKE